jgi:hypothetical protein
MKRGKGSKADRIEPEPVSDEIDQEQLDLELAELRHKQRQKQDQLPVRAGHRHNDTQDDNDARDGDEIFGDNDFHAPGAVDLDPRELQEARGHHKRGVIDLHPHEVEEAHDPHLPRTLQSKLFGIGPSGYFQLAVLCIAVGAVFEAGGLNPFDPGFTWQTALTGLGTGALNVIGWVIQAGWKPMLIGAAVTLPIWLVWRVLSVPFRR